MEIIFDSSIKNNFFIRTSCILCVVSKTSSIRSCFYLVTDLPIYNDKTTIFKKIFVYFAQFVFRNCSIWNQIYFFRTLNIAGNK